MDRDLRETVYSSESQMLNFMDLLRGMLTDLKACRFLAWRLFVRNLAAQHRQTVLGYVWLLLPPLMTTAIWVFLNSQNILNVAATDIPYPAFVLTGMLLWQGFVDALNSPLQMVQESRAMLTKINFPHEALIIAGLGGVLFNFVIRMSLMFLAFFWFSIPFSGTLILAPVGIMALMGLGLMIGLLLLPLALLYGDVQRLLTMATTLWFFVTPVIYPAPTNWPASLIANLNPVSPLLDTTRQWLCGGEANHLAGFLLVSACALVLLILGWIVYRLAMPHLISRLGA